MPAGLPALFQAADFQKGAASQGLRAGRGAGTGSASAMESGPCRLCGRAPTDRVTLRCGDGAPRHRGAEGGLCAWCSVGPEPRLRLPSDEGFGRRGSGMREKRSVRPLCEEHREEVKLFCETEGKMICVNCLDRRGERSHASHSFMLLNEAVEIYRAKIDSVIYSLKHRESTFQDFELKQRESISDIKEQSNKVQMLIDSEFAKLRSILDEKERGLVRELNEETGDILERMETNLREIRDNSQGTQQRLSSIEKQLSQKDVFSLLIDNTSQDRRALLTRIPGCRTSPQISPAQSSGADFARQDSEEEYYPKVVEGSLSLGVFQGPTQYTVWRQVKDIIHPNCTTAKKDHST